MYIHKGTSCIATSGGKAMDGEKELHCGRDLMYACFLAPGNPSMYIRLAALAGGVMKCSTRMHLRRTVRYVGEGICTVAVENRTGCAHACSRPGCVALCFSICYFDS